MSEDDFAAPGSGKRLAPHVVEAAERLTRRWPEAGTGVILAEDAAAEAMALLRTHGAWDHPLYRRAQYLKARCEMLRVGDRASVRQAERLLSSESQDGWSLGDAAYLRAQSALTGGAFDEASRHLELAARHYEREGQRSRAGLVENEFGMVAYRRGDWVGAERHWRNTLRLAVHFSAGERLHLILTTAAPILLNLQRAAESLDLFQQALEWAREQGDTWAEACAHLGLARAAMMEHPTDENLQHVTLAATAFQRWNALTPSGFCFVVESKIHAAQGRYDEAYRRLSQGKQILLSSADVEKRLIAQASFARLLALEGSPFHDAAASLMLLEECLREAEDACLPGLRGRILETLTQVCRQNDQPTRADGYEAELKGYVEHLRTLPVLSLAQAISLP